MNIFGQQLSLSKQYIIQNIQILYKQIEKLMPSMKNKKIRMSFVDIKNIQLKNRNTILMSNLCPSLNNLTSNRQNTIVKKSSFAKKQPQLRNYRICKPNKFKKTKNIIQSYIDHKFTKNLVNKKSFYQNKVNLTEISLQKQKSIQNINSKINKRYFNPKAFTDMRWTEYQQVDHQTQKQIQLKAKLKYLLQRNRKNNPYIVQNLLLNYNIPQLQKRFGYSRFELHQLYSIYSTLVSFAEGDMTKFIFGLQMLMSLKRIAIHLELLQSSFDIMKNSSNDIENNKVLTFQIFLGQYLTIENMIYKETVLLYVDNLFEGIKTSLNFQQIYSALHKRCSTPEAKSITYTIFDKLELEYEKNIEKKNVILLCYEDQDFYGTMAKIYRNQSSMS